MEITEKCGKHRNHTTGSENTKWLKRVNARIGQRGKVKTDISAKDGFPQTGCFHQNRVFPTTGMFSPKPGFPTSGFYHSRGQRFTTAGDRGLPQPGQGLPQPGKKRLPQPGKRGYHSRVKEVPTAGVRGLPQPVSEGLPQPV